MNLRFIRSPATPSRPATPNIPRLPIHLRYHITQPATVTHLPANVRIFALLPIIALTAIAGGCTTPPAPQPIVIVLPQDETSSLQFEEGPYVEFVADIKPILEAECVLCHNANSKGSQLDISSLDGVMASHENRPVLYPGEPERSPLFLVTVVPDHFAQAMPRGKHRLDEEDIWLIYQWILQGADWPEGADGTLKPAAKTRPDKSAPTPAISPDVV
jgi:hypothetical protein